MANDRYKLKDKSDAELHGWLAGHDSESDEYFAGIRELMDRNDAPASRREWIAMGIAIVSVTLAIIAVVVLYE